MHRSWTPLIRLVVSLLCLAPLANGQTQLTTVRVAEGLERPLWAGSPLGDSRIFVCEREGRIELFEGGSRIGTFLNLSSLLRTNGDQGLMSMAFHPNYENNGHFFVHYSRASDGASVISRWTVSGNPNVANSGSEVIVIVNPQEDTNHNGGPISFGPGGFLFIAFGDGGQGSNDPNCHGQRLDTWQSKVLRLDVDPLPYSIPSGNPYIGVPGALPEIFHIGLREPWRMSFDRETGGMYVGDVGEDAREEISFARQSESGLNFGWKVFEGTRCNGNGSCPGGIPNCAQLLGLPEYRPPTFELFHSEPSNPRSITGGNVYRGCAIPDLHGTYFFADFRDHIIRSFELNEATGVVSNFQDRTSELDPGEAQPIERIVSFGEDGEGEILIVKYNTSDPNQGRVYKIVPEDVNATAAGANIRNGSGANRGCYSTLNLPVLGKTWRAEIDLGGHSGVNGVAIQGRASTLAGAYVNGDEILISGFKLFKARGAPVGSIGPIDIPLPCDLSLSGMTARTQGYLFGSFGVELCNAIDLTLGAY